MNTTPSFGTKEAKIQAKHLQSKVICSLIDLYELKRISLAEILPAINVALTLSAFDTEIRNPMLEINLTYKAKDRLMKLVAQLYLNRDINIDTLQNYLICLYDKD